MAQVDYTPSNVTALINAGHSQSETARLTGVTSGAICKLLQKIDNQKDITTRFINHIPDLFIDTFSKSKLAIDKTLDWFNDLDIDSYSSLPHSAKIGFLNGAVIAGTHAYNNYRLETGQSTQNIDIQSLSAQIDTLDDVLKVIQSRRSGGSVKATDRDKAIDAVCVSLDNGDNSQ
jgi:hypothetical protein